MTMLDDVSSFPSDLSTNLNDTKTLKKTKIPIMHIYIYCVPAIYIVPSLN